ncbi:MAG: phosphoribosylaminoimidazolesuccinocarboxamide synthase [Steroidobacteraceae bacterium]
MDARPLFESKLTGLALLHRGKVRDNYAIDDRRLLIVATDRLSAFDVVMQDPIPGKGRILTAISNFWFGRTQRIVSNHLTGEALSRYVGNPGELELIEGRAVIAERLTPLPVEAVVRGYLAGSGWNDYRRDGRICGIRLPEGLRPAARLPKPIFTPATKAPAGMHDQNISYGRLVAIVGASVAARVRELALNLYTHAAEHALAHGIIIADTKFEFGLDHKRRVVLMDEVVTPDSSRFWPVDSYQEGSNPPSFDKQYVRDYLESLGWAKRPPAPKLPPDVIRLTALKYREAQHRLLS